VVSCIVCDKELELSFRGDSEKNSRQCHNAVMFSSGGNYGSTVWDPCNGRLELLVNICDECITRKKDQVTLVTIHRPLPEVTYSPWDPEADQG